MKIRPAHAIRINFVNSDGCVTGTTVSSRDPKLRVPYRKIEGGRKKAE
jgi:hypothetical protein